MSKVIAHERGHRAGDHVAYGYIAKQDNSIGRLFDWVQNNTEQGEHAWLRR